MNTFELPINALFKALSRNLRNLQIVDVINIIVQQRTFDYLFFEFYYFWIITIAPHACAFYL